MMIRWIIILCAIFAVTEIFPEPFGKRDRVTAQEPISITCPDDAVPAPGLSSDPGIKLPPVSRNAGVAVPGPTRLARVDALCEAPVARIAGGRIFGRAPPVDLSA